MATRMQALCDPHLAQDVEVDASPYVIRIGVYERQVDLCTDDYDLLLKPVMALLADHGRKIEPAGGVTLKYAKTAKDGKNRGGVCPLPGCEPAGKEWGNLSTHFRTAHGKSITQWRMETGQLSSDAPAYLCPVDGCGRVFERTQSLGAHMSRAHQGKHINDFPREALRVPIGGPGPKAKPVAARRGRKTAAAKR